MNAASERASITMMMSRIPIRSRLGTIPGNGHPWAAQCLGVNTAIDTSGFQIEGFSAWEGRHMPIIREHEFDRLGWCVHCGIASPAKLAEIAAKKNAAREPGTTPEVVAPLTALCLPRDTGKLAPAPARRTFACNDVATISARLAELRKEADAALAR